VDEQLCHFVLASTRTPTVQLAETIRALYMQRFVASLNQYYQMALQATANPAPATRLGPMDSFVRRRDEDGNEDETPTISQSRIGRGLNHEQLSTLTNLKFKLKRATRHYDAIAKMSSIQNIELEDIDGVGNAKKRKFALLGIHSCHDLLQLYNNKELRQEQYESLRRCFRERESERIIANYIQKMQVLLNDREQETEEAGAMVSSLQQEISSLEALGEMPSSAGAASTGGTIDINADSQETSQQHPSTTTTTTTIQEYSKFEDTAGYNGRFFSAYYIECIFATHFNLQKPGMLQLMSCIGGEVLSMDTMYKAPKRVTVYVNGKPFCPWVGLTTVMNEHGACIWWGFIKGSESISEIAPHLKRLKARLDRIQGPDTLKVIYVDNCCNVRAKLQEIFGNDVLVCLDIFHWLQRWEDCIRDRHSERYAVFRALMSRAVLQASPEEYSEQKLLVEKKLGRVPTVKEVLAACHTVTPPVDAIHRSISAIVEYFLMEDAKAVARAGAQSAEEEVANLLEPRSKATESSTQQQRLFFKDHAIVRKKHADQSKHIKCIVDPAGVCLHRTSPEGKKYCSRGSSKNERLNRKVNEDVLRFPIIAAQRAERAMWQLLDGWNRKANIVRSGGTDYHIANIESLAYGNALALEAGCQELPFNISLPTTPVTQGNIEYMGFELCKEGVGVPTGDLEDMVGNNEQEDDGRGGIEVCVGAGSSSDGEEEEDSSTYLAHQVDNQEMVNNAVNQIETIIHAACEPQISQSQSSLQVFSAMTGNCPWLPFSDDNNAIAKAERELFETMKDNYNRHANRSGPKGYNKFSSDWDIETGRRYLMRLSGDEDIVPIYRKTAEQLASFFDTIAEKKAAAQLSTTTGLDKIHQVNSILKAARAGINRPVVIEATLIVFPQELSREGRHTHLGAPLTLNTKAAFPQPIPMNPGCTRKGAAPFLSPPRLEQVVPQIPRRRPLNLFKKVCIKCGRSRGEHYVIKEGCTSRSSMFGSSQCPYTHCARCGLDQAFHMSGIMGVDCTISHLHAGVPEGMLLTYDIDIARKK